MSLRYDLARKYARQLISIRRKKLALNVSVSRLFRLAKKAGLEKAEIERLAARLADDDKRLLFSEPAPGAFYRSVRQ